MSFTEVQSIEDMKTEYRRLSRKYDSMKYQYLDSIGAEDFEVLGVNDFLELKELYIQKKKLYWKIHELEHPKDTATREAYRFLNTMSHNEQNDFLMKHHLTTHRLIDAIRENPNFLNEVTA